VTQNAVDAVVTVDPVSEGDIGDNSDNGDNGANATVEGPPEHAPADAADARSGDRHYPDDERSRFTI
jgi:hypothetical protein